VSSARYQRRLRTKIVKAPRELGGWGKLAALDPLQIGERYAQLLGEGWPVDAQVGEQRLQCLSDFQERLFQAL
jgi:hypothetical protein